jgi:hypothetical protein
MDDGALHGSMAAVTAAEPAGPQRAAPRILLLTTERWPMAALLAHALMDAGFAVWALCPKDHPMRVLDELAGAPVYDHLRRHAQLRRVVTRLAPDLVIPCDDLAVAVLHEHHALCHGGARGVACGALIERSLGDPDQYGLLRRKSAFIRLAAEHGVRTPATVVIESAADLSRRLVDATFPLVVKADGWSGGRGTRIVRSADEALAAHASLSRPISWISAIKDSLREGASLPLVQRARAVCPTVTLQAFAAGAPVNRAVVCHGGAVIAGRTFEAVQTMPNNGNATVVRPRHIPQIDAAVERCVALLGLSGLAGFDFMYNEATGAAYLLEVNPRATSACYTALQGEPDLADALFAAATGSAAFNEPIGNWPDTALIALFPQETERDPQSPYLQNAHQQAPLDRPDLVRACLAQAIRQTTYARIVAAVRATRSAAVALARC